MEPSEKSLNLFNPGSENVGVAIGRAIRSYCTGISHGPVSAAIANAKHPPNILISSGCVPTACRQNGKRNVFRGISSEKSIRTSFLTFITMKTPVILPTFETEFRGRPDDTYVPSCPQ